MFDTYSYKKKKYKNWSRDFDHITRSLSHILSLFVKVTKKNKIWYRYCRELSINKSDKITIMSYLGINV